MVLCRYQRLESRRWRRVWGVDPRDHRRDYRLGTGIAPSADRARVWVRRMVLNLTNDAGEGVDYPFYYSFAAWYGIGRLRSRILVGHCGRQFNETVRLMQFGRKLKAFASSNLSNMS